MNKKDLIKRLIPFWKEQEKALGSYFKKLEKIEKKINKIKLKYPLEFFFVEGNCVGIGARNYEDRKKVSLIHDTELNE